MRGVDDTRDFSKPQNYNEHKGLFNELNKLQQKACASLEAACFWKTMYYDECINIRLLNIQLNGGKTKGKLWVDTTKYN